MADGGQRFKFTAARKVAFLTELARGSVVTEACKVAGIAYNSALAHRDASESFAKMWDAAVEQGTDVLEQEALRRAAHGTKRPVFQNGEKVGDITEYSDQLLMFLLKGRRPEKFRERLDVTSDGKSITAAFAAALRTLPSESYIVTPSARTTPQYDESPDAPKH